MPTLVRVRSEAPSGGLLNLAPSFRAGFLQRARAPPHLLHFNGFPRKPLKCRRWGKKPPTRSNPALKDWARLRKTRERASNASIGSPNIFSQPLTVAAL